MSFIKFGEYEPEMETITTDMYNGTSLQHLYWFSNGYGASVVQNFCSYGHEDGLYEVAEHLSRIEKLPDLKEKRKEGSKLCNTQKLYSK